MNSKHTTTQLNLCRIFLILLAAGLLAVLPAKADTLASYQGVFSPTFFATNSLVASDVTIAGLAGYGPYYMLTHDTGVSSAALALSLSPPNDYSYLEFSVTPQPGYSISLSSLDFDAEMYMGESQGLVASSSIGGLDQALSSFSISGSTWTSFSVDLSGSAFEDITTPTTFRILGYGPGQQWYETASVDNMNLIGTIAVVPEPSTLALSAVGGLVGLLLFRRRK